MTSGLLGVLNKGPLVHHMEVVVVRVVEVEQVDDLVELLLPIEVAHFHA